MKKTLMVSEPFLIGGNLVVSTIDDSGLLKKGVRLIDEKGQSYAVNSIAMNRYANGSINVVLDGPKEIGKYLTLV